MCLVHALTGQATFRFERVAQAYLWWYKSRPFDIGNTTIAGLGGGLGSPKGEIHLRMKRAAEELNRDAKLNGSLMRIAPLEYGDIVCRPRTLLPQPWQTAP